MVSQLADRTGMTTTMKGEPTPSDREVLTGLAERVTYQNAENGFCVVRVNRSPLPCGMSQAVVDGRSCVSG
jgi:hypothetical protein